MKSKLLVKLVLLYLFLWKGFGDDILIYKFDEEDPYENKGGEGSYTLVEKVGSSGMNPGEIVEVSDGILLEEYTYLSLYTSEGYPLDNQDLALDFEGRFKVKEYISTTSTIVFDSNDVFLKIEIDQSGYLWLYSYLFNLGSVTLDIETSRIVPENKWVEVGAHWREEEIDGSDFCTAEFLYFIEGDSDWTHIKVQEECIGFVFLLGDMDFGKGSNNDHIIWNYFFLNIPTEPLQSFECDEENEFCTKCINNKCLECEETYTLELIEELEYQGIPLGYCVPDCGNENCASCSDHNICEECDTDYVLETSCNSPEECRCLPICEEDMNCESCDTPNHCDSCVANYDFDLDSETPNTCIPACNLDNSCISCDDTPLLCSGCKFYSQFDSVNLCTPLCNTDEFCEICTEDIVETATYSSTCTDCVEYYNLDSDLTEPICEPQCDVENCDQCSLPNVCAECADGYDLQEDEEQPACIPECDVDNCIECSSPNVCSDCDDNYTLQEDEDPPTCIEIPEIPECTVDNCVECSSSNSDECLTCAQDYNLNTEKTCDPICSTNCKICTQPNTCDECNEGYILTDNGCEKVKEEEQGDKTTLILIIVFSVIASIGGIIGFFIYRWKKRSRKKIINEKETARVSNLENSIIYSNPPDTVHNPLEMNVQTN